MQEYARVYPIHTDIKAEYTRHLSWCMCAISLGYTQLNEKCISQKLKEYARVYPNLSDNNLRHILEYMCNLTWVYVRD